MFNVRFWLKSLLVFPDSPDALLNAWLAFLGSITKLPFHNQPPFPGSKTTNPEALKRALRSMKESIQVLSDSVLSDNRHSNIPLNSLYS